MFYILKVGIRYYKYLMTEVADERVKDWYLMGSIETILAMQLLYLLFVLKLGPKWMETRKAFNLDKLLIVYNLTQMLINGYIFTIIAPVMFRTFNYYCNPVDYSDNADSMNLLYGTYLYFLTKIMDLFDTIVFVFRKKEKQVTFLHVYHHFVMVLYVWILTKFIGGGQTMFVPLCNTLVHFCMYGYYTLTVWKKEFKNSIWWKRHLTELQLAQFFIAFVVLLGPVLSKNCAYPRFVSAILMPQNLFFLGLFGDFYLKAYILPKKMKEKVDAEIKQSTKNLLNMCNNQFVYTNT